MAATRWKPLPPRPINWEMKPLSSAETGVKTLADGRLELTIRHDVLKGVTPAMLGYGRVKFLPIIVFEQTTTTVNWNLSSAVAVTLLLITMAFLAVHRLVLRSHAGSRAGTSGRGWFG